MVSTVGRTHRAVFCAYRRDHRSLPVGNIEWVDLPLLRLVRDLPDDVVIAPELLDGPLDHLLLVESHPLISGRFHTGAGVLDHRVVLARESCARGWTGLTRVERLGQVRVPGPRAGAESVVGTLEGCEE